jgi:D-alanyl-D-alanine carboxypeptidase
MRDRLVIAIVSLGLSFAQWPARGARRDVDFRELDKVVAAELKETNAPGAACAVVSGDRIVYEKGFGVSDIETGAPVTPSMLFRTGSINKMLTAAVLVALADEGKIALDAPLAKSVPGLAPGLSRLTADQLLSHTAGLI